MGWNGEGRVSFMLFPRSCERGVNEAENWLRPRRGTLGRTVEHGQRSLDTHTFEEGSTVSEDTDTQNSMD